jgi:hypothetical protein
MGDLIELCVGAACGLVALQIWSRAELVSRWLIGLAILRLPEEQRIRRQEEWLGHLEETRGPARILLHGIGCWISAPAVGRIVIGRVHDLATTPSFHSQEAHYIETMTRELCRMCRQAELDDLAYLLEVAAAEAAKIGALKARSHPGEPQNRPPIKPTDADDQYRNEQYRD